MKNCMLAFRGAALDAFKTEEWAQEVRRQAIEAHSSQQESWQRVHGDGDTPSHSDWLHHPHTVKGSDKSLILHALTYT